MPISEPDYVVKFDQTLLHFFRSALLRSRFSLPSCTFLLKTLANQHKAKIVRGHWAKQGTKVPPLMIVSITNRCNLQCKGCYARALHTTPEEEMTDERLFEVVREANELGISIIMIAGGEPLLRPVFYELAHLYPQILFPVFTNGLLIDKETICMFKKLHNLVPILSLEGEQMETDIRRGSGVYTRVKEKMNQLAQAGIFFGTSITLTRQNFYLTTSLDFQQGLSLCGSQVSIFVDYVPVKAGTESLVLTSEQKAHESFVINRLRQQLPGSFVSLPGDETLYGGCLAAGRGFIHVNPSGHLEPCPFAPFSDADLREMSLKEALCSDFLRVIRENANKLGESQGGCTLWENRDWVLAQMSGNKS